MRLCENVEEIFVKFKPAALNRVQFPQKSHRSTTAPADTKAGTQLKCSSGRGVGGRMEAADLYKMETDQDGN